MNKIWIVLSLLLIINFSGYTEPLYIIFNNQRGYFIPEDEFDEVLLALANLEWHKNYNAILEDENTALRSKNFKIATELWITRGVTVLSLLLSVSHSLIREMGK